MVFMGADAFDGSEPLDRALEDDLEEIASVGGAKTLEIFVEVHRSKGHTARYHYGFDAAKNLPTVTDRTIQSFNADSALIQFVADSLVEADHRPDDHSMLVLWGHAYDFAFARSRTRNGSVDSIDFVELSAMLQRLQDVMFERMKHLFAQHNQGRPTLDVVGFDTCDAASVELACELAPFAKYLLGSEIGVPLPGWPYDRVFGRLKQPQGDRLMSPAEFGSWAIRRYCESYDSSSPVSLSYLDLGQTETLRRHAEILALSLAVVIADPERREQVADLFLSSRTADDRPYVDVADLCLGLVRAGIDPFVTEAARALGDFLMSPRFPVAGTSASGTSRPLVVDHGRNSVELARLNGISLYAPHVRDGDFADVRTLYEKFLFSQKTMWSGLVHSLAAEF